MANLVQLLKWPYKKQGNLDISKKKLKRDYNLILSFGEKHPLYVELFSKVNKRYLPLSKMKTVKDFHIKDSEYIKKIRKIHEKTKGK